MSSKKKKALGRGMSSLVEGSFSSIVDAAPAGTPGASIPAPEAARPAPARSPAEPEAARPAAAPAPQPLRSPRSTAPLGSDPEPPQPAPVSRRIRIEPAAARPASRPSLSEASDRTGRAAPDKAPWIASPPVPAAAAAPLTSAAAQAATRPFDVVSVASGKGGTGKSILTSNLGVLLAGATRVTLLDADLGLANIHILYNMMPRYNVSHVIAGEKSLEEIILHGPRGVSIIPGGSGIPELASLTDGMFGALIREIASLDRSTDLLLVDTPSGIDRQSLIFLLASDQIMVVTTEDITAMTDAYALIKTVLAHRPAASVALVVNQARSYADGLETFHKVAHVARKFLGREVALGGIIPFDEMVERSVEERIPVAISQPGCPAARAMASLASRVGTFHSRSPRAGQPFTLRLQGLLASQPLRSV